MQSSFEELFSLNLLFTWISLPFQYPVKEDNLKARYHVVRYEICSKFHFVTTKMLVKR